MYFALAKELPAQVCFSFTLVGLPWLRHVLFGRESFGRPLHRCGPAKSVRCLVYATVVEMIEILTSSLIVDHRGRRCRGCGRAGCKDGRRPKNRASGLGCGIRMKTPGTVPMTGTPSQVSLWSSLGSIWMPLTEVVKRCVVTPRFPVDESWKWKDKKKRILNA